MPAPADQVAVELAAAHRGSQLELRSVTVAELVRLWPALDWRRLDATFPAWSSATTTVIQRHRARSANLAAAYVQRARDAAGIRGIAPVAHDTAAFEQVAVSLRVTGPVAIKSAIHRGVSSDEAMRRAFVMSSGAATRLVLQGGRDTIIGSVLDDPKALGWARVSSDKPCAFCAMLISRGAVYKRTSFDRSDPRFEGHGQFKVHDHCSCTMRPLYRHEEPPQHEQDLADLWARVTAGLTGAAARAAFRRAYATS